MTKKSTFLLLSMVSTAKIRSQWRKINDQINRNQIRFKSLSCPPIPFPIVILTPARGPRSRTVSMTAVYRHTRLSLSAAHWPSGGDMNTLPLPHTHNWYTLGNLSSTPRFFDDAPIEFCWPPPIDLPPLLSPTPPVDVPAAAELVFTVFKPLKNTLAASIWIYTHTHTHIHCDTTFLTCLLIN